MDRLNQLRGEAGGSKDSTLDTTSPPSVAFITANESSSKYFSLSEVDSTFDISGIKDVSLTTTATAESEGSISNPDELISNLSPISKKSDMLEGYKIGKQIEAANILSGGVDIFDDNENSYDGDELVIDDNIEVDEKSNPESKQGLQFKSDDDTASSLIGEEADIGSKDTEVVLQIDGKNVDAIDIGNGLYLYRKEGEEELAAVQIIDDGQQQPNFKFLKVRENAEGNLEVYEEIEIEVPKEVPAKDGKAADKNTSSHVPIKDINKVISESSCNKTVERKIKTPQKEPTTTSSEVEIEDNKDTITENKSDFNFNGKMMKFTESRKSPVIGSFTYHSTPNKEGKPLTKIMVDQHLHPNRHSDNVKKTIEVHTDGSKPRINEPQLKNKYCEDNKVTDACNIEKEVIVDETNEKNISVVEEKNLENSEPTKIDGSNKIPEKKNETKINTECANNDTTKMVGDAEKEVKLDDPTVTGKVVPMDLQVTSIATIETKDEKPIDKLNNVVVPMNMKEIATVGNEEKIKEITSEVTSSESVRRPQESMDVVVAKEKQTGTDEQDTINKAHEPIKENIFVAEQSKEVSDSNLEKDGNVTKDIHLSEENPSQNTELVKTNDSVKVLEQANANEVTSSSLDSLCDVKVSSPISNKETKIIDKLENKNEKVAITKEIINVTRTVSMSSTEECKKQDDPLIENLVPKKVDEKIEPEKEEGTQIIPKPTPCCKEADTNKVKGIVYLPTPSLPKAPEKLSQVTEPAPNLQHVKNYKEIIDYKPSKIVSTSEKIISNMHKCPINKPQEKVGVQEVKPVTLVNKNIEKKAVVPTSTAVSLKPVTEKTTMNTKVDSNVLPKIEPAKIFPSSMALKQSAGSSLIDKKVDNSIKNKIEPKDKKEMPKINPEPKPINNNHAAVPFGQWTDANRQEFLNKFKAKAPAASSNGNQIKNSNDLNRRDVLKKIDSQRQSSNALSKSQEANKLAVKNETAFSKTNIVPQESKIPVKSEATELKVEPVANKIVAKQEKVNKPQTVTSTKTVTANEPKKEAKQRAEVNYQDLIDKTIEDMLHRGAPSKGVQDEIKHNQSKDASSQPRNTNSYQQNYPPIDEVATLDAIEMKMNELHGIPFIERPAHELPQVNISELKISTKPEKEKQPTSNKSPKIPNLLPFSNKSQQNVPKENVIEVDSEEEIIEHEPITGDIIPQSQELIKKSSAVKPVEKLQSSTIEKLGADAPKKEAIITEKDFDKFARRNSITYENRITVNFDGKEPHNVIQTVVEKDAVPKSYSRNDSVRVDNKAKIHHKYQNIGQNTQTTKLLLATKFEQANDESSSRSQSKLQKAYHSALTAKRQMECPITIIEDKPVKVVFMDNVEFIPNQLNVQGQDLSPPTKLTTDSDVVTIGTGNSMDSDLLDAPDDAKSQDEAKVKTKHQRKQVLTPVNEPELELIEPTDLGLKVSPKKKRKTEDDKSDKTLKYPMRKKMYMLGSTEVEEKQADTHDVTINPLKESVNRNEIVNSHNSSVSAIDNLVKAAELLETQTENPISANDPESNSQQSTPVKRGRGRPRKYPLPDGVIDKTKVPSPQKKPRLIDAKLAKQATTTDEEDSDGEIVKENWTMGKINENIVCPICNKLFRTENVVFKHVKHCTGPSPNRSDSDKRSPRRIRQSQESDDWKSCESKSDDMDIDDEKLSDIKLRKETPKKRKSKDSITKSDSEIIVIEDTPDKEKLDKVDDRKQHESRKQKSKIPHKSNDLVCEFCGKTFRQLSYLANHKLLHKKENPKKVEKEAQVANKSVYVCEVCKKEFRKLHHLVQHRIIHNPSLAPVRTLRKSSSEQSECKTEKEPSTSKQSEDPSAGFRCEPCDKSFRKLHHLVEHRETHDGINRQKTTTVTQTNPEKPVSVHACEICKKTFRKMHHLIEHKEQHMDTGSEKSDDKSVKSSLSTKDIIHECSLCYMVFPNEHSLNKHTIICQRKKRQSKQKQVEGAEITEEGAEGTKMDVDLLEDVEPPKPAEEIIKVPKEDIQEKENVVEKVDLLEDKIDETAKVPKKENSPPKDAIEIKENPPDQPITMLPLERDSVESNISNIKKDQVFEIPENIKKVEEKENVKILDTPKKKTPLKDKFTPSAIKRNKISTAVAPAVEEPISAVESSDDDEVRYMLNPNFKVEETEEKVFMKVRAKKRSSLQIERPNSKDLVKRRISLQHPPKIPRLKQKSVDNNTTIKNVVKAPKLEPVPSTDSDDSDVKYSFPKTAPEKTSKPISDRTPKNIERKTPKKSIAEKRKSLSAIAKRKSLGKAVTARHKPSPVKQVKRRIAEVEHRCDCGQLFSSAALLSRHTSLAHTPPRIRRRRSPPPEQAKPVIKPPPRKSSIADNHTKPKQNAASRKSSVRSDTSTSNVTTKPTKTDTKPTRKSTDKDAKTPGDAKKQKADKSEAKSSVKPRRSGAHRGVPVPDKMRKLMQKNK